MVWYIPPLSPLAGLEDQTKGAELIDRLRLPVKYLANLLAAGDEAPVRLALKRLMALRSFMRKTGVEQEEGAGMAALEEVGLTREGAEQMYRLLAIAKYGERFVIPTVRREEVQDLHRDQGACGFPPQSQGGSDD
jgi:nitrate reductase beta subunit